jgi:hypothetical protein
MLANVMYTCAFLIISLLYKRLFFLIFVFSSPLFLIVLFLCYFKYLVIGF